MSLPLTGAGPAGPGARTITPAFVSIPFEGAITTHIAFAEEIVTNESTLTGFSIAGNNPVFLSGAPFGAYIEWGNPVTLSDILVISSNNDGITAMSDGAKVAAGNHPIVGE